MRGTGPQRGGGSMNHYEEKQAARRERYAELADKAKRESGQLFDRAHDILDRIPLGQPILIGHHSEGRHRADIGRADSAMRRGCEAADKAQYYAGKAAGVDRAGISSDDPDATAKLRAKLEKLEKLQAVMKDVNAAIRKGKPNTFQDRGISDAVFAQLLERDCMGDIGFASYQLSNNNAEIRRLKQRIADMEQAAQTEARPDVELPGLTIHEDKEFNRVMLYFDGKPDPATIAELKSWGFRWMHTEKAWTRHLNNSGRWAAKRIADYWTARQAVQS
jgi:hypothetical protein